MKRREFITLFGGMAVASLQAANGQQERVRRIGALINRSAGDQEATDSIEAFTQKLTQLGWTIGGNLQVEYRYSAGNGDAIRKYAAELIALAPDVILAAGTVGVAALQQLSRSIPVVFTVVTDPVAAGFVDSLARPGGNITGLMQSEYSLNGKLLEMLIPGSRLEVFEQGGHLFMLTHREQTLSSMRGFLDAPDQVQDKAA